MRTLILTGLLLGTQFLAFEQTDKPKPAYDFSLPREERISVRIEALGVEFRYSTPLRLFFYFSPWWMAGLAGEGPDEERG